MSITLALAGDTMLGRMVGSRLREDPDWPLLDDAVAAAARQADLFILNLECCISDRGERWPDPAKRFFFRAPPAAAERLAKMGAGAVTLANNHALDYGPEALQDTLDLLRAAGVAALGAGPDAGAARQPIVVRAGEARVGLVAFSDHPADFAAGAGRPGVAYADLRGGAPPQWVLDAISGLDADVVVVTPHWGPNMTPSPVDWVRASARALADAGAHVVAGHSAHVFHGVKRHGPAALLYDLGDFIDDYAVDEQLRNDLGVLWLVEIGAQGVAGIEALPLKLEFCRTTAARDAERDRIRELLARRCTEFGGRIEQAADGRLAVLPPP